MAERAPVPVDPGTSGPHLHPSDLKLIGFGMICESTDVWLRGPEGIHHRMVGAGIPSLPPKCRASAEMEKE